MSSFNIDGTLKIIKILRGNNYTTNNCIYLVNDLITYFKSGIIPEHPSSTNPSNENDFDTLINIDWIKRLDGTKYLGIVKSTICQTNFINISNGYVQKSAHIKDINQCLIQEGTFGYINLGRCGKFSEEPGHMLAYFSTKDQVWYIDCTLYDGINNCIFNNLDDKYNFADEYNINIDVFGEYVFYIPIESAPLITQEKHPLALINNQLNTHPLLSNNHLNHQNNDLKVYFEPPVPLDHYADEPSAFIELIKDTETDSLINGIDRIDGIDNPKQKKSPIKYRLTCEHGKNKSRCEVCIINEDDKYCIHKKLSYRCEECKRTKKKTYCSECVGNKICKHQRKKDGDKNRCDREKDKTFDRTSDGNQICKRKEQNSDYKQFEDSTNRKHNKIRADYFDYREKGICEHNEIKFRSTTCVDVKNTNEICVHNNEKYYCVECSEIGAINFNVPIEDNQTCIHGKIKYRCMKCNGASLCIHEKLRYKCVLCKKRKITSENDEPNKKMKIDLSDSFSDGLFG